MSSEVSNLQLMFLGIQNVIRSQQFTINIPQSSKCHQKVTIYNQCISATIYKVKEDATYLSAKTLYWLLKDRIKLKCSQCHPTYTATTLSKRGITDNHMLALSPFWFLHERWGLWSSLAVLDIKITQVSIQTTLYCRSCQVFYQVSF